MKLWFETFLIFAIFMLEFKCHSSDNVIKTLILLTMYIAIRPFSTNVKLS